MGHPTYERPRDALEATDAFYATEEGFQYTEDQVTRWVSAHVTLPRKGRVLDLCCGDGIWSLGIQRVGHKVDVFGIDISEGAIEKARRLLRTDAEHFVVGDAESELPWPEGFFDVIFARGPGLYNQHDMDRPAAIRLIEHWHSRLAPEGKFYSIFYSKPELMGEYTPMDRVKLPYNRCPRKTDAVDFRGGKYHHTIRSFLTPFWKARGIDVQSYAFLRNTHILVTRRARSPEP